jgi:hypothetical protein
VDGERFDNIIKGLSTKHVTRLSAIRGLLGGAAAAAVAVTGGADAKGAMAQANPSKKKTTICHCPDEFAASCKTIKIRRWSAKKHLKHPCDYKGPCTGVSGCPT